MWPFKKKPPVPEFVSYIRIYQDGHGTFKMKRYAEPDMCFWIPCPGTLRNIEQAERYAEKVLSDIKKSDDVKFISQIPK